LTPSDNCKALALALEIHSKTCSEGCAIRQQASDLREFLVRAVEYFEDRADINFHGGPNEAMKLQQMAEGFLREPENDEKPPHVHPDAEGSYDCERCMGETFQVQPE
jgi:hypothetical protein